MSDDTVPHSDIKGGIYDALLSQALQSDLASSCDPRFIDLADVDAEDSHSAIAQYLERLFTSSLSTLRGRDLADRQRRLVDQLIETLVNELGDDWAERFNLANPLQRLLAVHSSEEDSPAHRPDTPLARSALLTGTRHDPSLVSQLNKEFAQADRVDILCSFIKWSGTRLLMDSLRELTSTPHPDGPRLRLITTSYMGATDPRAIEELRELPNTEVKVSYDTQRTRLHAKAYIIHRETGFGSGYIGSANISRAALSEGLEWTSKVSQYELPHMWQKIIATFESYWNDDEFEPYGRDGLPRLQEAIKNEREPANIGGSDFPMFDLRPYPFQEEILDAISAEREVQDKHRHLVVAATGTGKTMIAAFDYRAWAGKDRPSLLFIAHREEILKQALGTFRAVLRDHNFGDLLVGGTDPSQSNHLFCSIQSYNSRKMTGFDPDKFDYIVVDEFHHAAAPSYKRLLEHVEPGVLLGLTATPERSDGMNILQWFGGEPTAEIRLPDAIDRRLLSPFQYFGVTDSEDLSGIRWQRGGYSIEDLDRVYTGNDVRAGLVMDKVRETLLDPNQTRGLGFCVSVAHANFMAKFFDEHGIPSLALSADSSKVDRQTAKERLVRREINFIFVVDLYNEGVDIPEIDTVLFLRPTESLTIYLQQLGRGLRLHDNKDCLTVIDFIGSQRKEFRFASRFRALSTDPTGRLEREIEIGFPHLPAGCSIQLERVAQQRILENVRHTLSLRKPQMINDLRELGRHLGKAPTIQQAIEYLDTTIDEVFKRGLWSKLLSDAGLIKNFNSPDEDQLAKGIRRLAHIDDPRQIRYLLAHLNGEAPDDPLADRRRTMLHVTLWGRDGASMSLDEADARLHTNPSAVGDLRSLLEYRLRHTRTRLTDLIPLLAGPLALHAKFTRDEILVGLGHWDMDRRPDFREGVLHLADKKIDAFFPTLNKTEGQYSPTTMYEDYVINDSLFHWQSQSTTSAQSPTGKRYINHREMGYTPLLFVREHKSSPGGLASPYSFLGPAKYMSHEGSRPMSIVWHIDSPMPSRLLRRIS